MKVLAPFLFASSLLLAGETFDPATLKLDWSELALPPECAEAATKVIADFRKCKPFNLLLTIRKEDRVIATVEGLGRNHYHSFELKGAELFWVRRAEETIYGNDGRPNNYVELWVMDLVTRKKEKLGAARDLDYRISPSGELVLVQKARELFLLNRKKSETTPIFETSGTTLSEAIDLHHLGWDSDTEFHFAVGIGEECRKVGRYRVGRDEPLDWIACPGAD